MDIPLPHYLICTCMHVHWFISVLVGCHSAEVGVSEERKGGDGLLSEVRLNILATWG